MTPETAAPNKLEELGVLIADEIHRHAQAAIGCQRAGHMAGVALAVARLQALRDLMDAGYLLFSTDENAGTRAILKAMGPPP